MTAVTDRPPPAGDTGGTGDAGTGGTGADRSGPEPAGRADRRAVARAFRPRRSIPAVVVAGLLAVAAILVAVEVISYLVDRPAGILPVDRLARLGRQTRWDDPGVITAAVVAIGLGLLLLWLALSPGRVRALGLVPHRSGVVMAVTWPALRRVAVYAAETVDGVGRARARVGRGGIRVRVDTPLRDPGDLAGQVRWAVTDRVAGLAPQRPLRVRVGVRVRGD